MIPEIPSASGSSSSSLRTVTIGRPRSVSALAGGNRMSDSFICIGIDFGTTFSGVAWAWSGKGDIIKVVSNWKVLPADYKSVDSSKAPSLIHYGPDGRSRWGYEIPSDVEPLKWIKLLLLDEADAKKLKKSADLRKAREALERSGKSAERVCADYLNALWNHTIRDIRKEFGEGMDRIPYRVVVTHPAIWNEKSIRKLREAIVRSRILVPRYCGETTLHFVSEPEAAALATFQDMGQRPNFKPNDTFVVCDAGGGTVDLISYKIHSDFPSLDLRECVEGDGGLCGAIFIDQRFENLIAAMLSAEELFQGPRPEYLKKMMNREWENGIKRCFDTKQDQKWTVELPQQLMRATGVLSPQLSLKTGHVKSCFSRSITQIRDLVNVQIEEIEKKEGGRKPKAIVLVGGLGSCHYLYETLLEDNKKEGIEVYQASGDRPWSSICRGAVIKGLTNSTFSGVRVSSRISRMSYGTTYMAKFKRGIHSVEDLVVDKLDNQGRADNQMKWQLRKVRPRARHG
jgi:hypothetical protein